MVENLWPLPGPEFSVANLRTWTEETLRSKRTGDALRDNLILNKWEFAHGITVLRSYPWRLSVPFVLCNAQCEFCAAWQIKGHAPLDDLITALVPVIRHCYQLDLVGWGEPLIHPQFSHILDVIKGVADPRARMALTTNGVRLDEWIDRLLDANVMDYAISIHAARTETHQDLMGLRPDDFDRVLTATQKLVSRKREFAGLSVETVLVVTPMEAPRDGLDYHRLPPYLHPEFESLREVALSAIARSRLPIRSDPETWSRPVFSPEWEARLDRIPLTARKDRKTYYRTYDIRWDELGAGEASREQEPCSSTANLYDRAAPLYCPSPYTAFYTNGTDRRVIPCVYMHKVPGHEFIHFKPSMTFEQVWNSPAMVAVRRSLHEGPLMPDCLKCPFFC